MISSLIRHFKVKAFHHHHARVTYLKLTQNYYYYLVVVNSMVTNFQRRPGTPIALLEIWQIFYFQGQNQSPRQVLGIFQTRLP